MTLRISCLTQAILSQEMEVACCLLPLTMVPCIEAVTCLACCLPQLRCTFRRGLPWQRTAPARQRKAPAVYPSRPAPVQDFPSRPPPPRPVVGLLRPTLSPRWRESPGQDSRTPTPSSSMCTSLSDSSDGPLLRAPALALPRAPVLPALPDDHGVPHPDEVPYPTFVRDFWVRWLYGPNYPVPYSPPSSSSSGVGFGSEEKRS